MDGLTAMALALVTMMSGDPFARTCETRVEGPETPEYVARPAHDVALGRLVFMGLGDRVGIARDGAAKVPVLLNAGAPVTVRVVPLGRTRARLDFDTDEWRNERRAGQRAVRFEACAPETPRFTDGRPLGPQTGYNGGFLVRRPGCVRLIARSPGEATVRRRVALGVPPRRCD